MDYKEFSILEPSQKTMDRIEVILTYQPMTIHEIIKKLDNMEYRMVNFNLVRMLACGTITKKTIPNVEHRFPIEITYYGLTDYYPISEKLVKEMIE